jgi:hypothetical protein
LEEKIAELATTRELYLLTFIKEFMEFIVSAAESVAPTPASTTASSSLAATSVLPEPEDRDGPVLDPSNCHPDPIIQVLYAVINRAGLKLF